MVPPEILAYIGAVVVVLAFVVDASRRRAWGWVISLVFFFPVAALAWILTGRRLYPSPRER